MREIERDDIVELAAQTRCVVCKTPYGRNGIQVLGRDEGAWSVAFTCSHCGAEGVMVATVEEDAAGHLAVDRETETRPKIMYDVTYEEWMAFQEQTPISRDDVLDTHLFLGNFDGDFAKFFADRTAIEDNAK